MYQVVYSGIDTLDVAFKGAFSKSVLETLETARTDAETSDQVQPAQLGPGLSPVLVKPSGRKGGYRYVFDNGPAGAIFAAKPGCDPTQWNLFVSLRALRLLTLGYEGSKAWLSDTLAAMGFDITGISVNRIDYAVDIHAPSFELDIENLITPAQAKARSHWSKESWFEEDKHQPKSVLRGRRFESVTIGTMPNRQVILYDKRRAAFDKRELYWFDAWHLDQNDPTSRVWRAEIRAGRDALAKLIPHERTYEAVEAQLKPFLTKTTQDIRYLEGPSAQKNVSRIPSHKLWAALQETHEALSTKCPPPLLDSRALEALRRQRLEMCLKQAYGNALNALVLDGISPKEIAENFELYAARTAAAYARDIGQENILKKAEEISQRLAFLSPL